MYCSVIGFVAMCMVSPRPPPCHARTDTAATAATSTAAAARSLPWPFFLCRLAFPPEAPSVPAPRPFSLMLCWNTHPFRTDDIVLKLSADLIGSPIFINTLSLKDYDGYLEKMKRLCQSGYDKNILPEATTKAIEQKIFSESRTLTVSEPFSLSLHIQCETLCFISILPLE